MTNSQHLEHVPDSQPTALQRRRWPRRFCWGAGLLLLLAAVGYGFLYLQAAWEYHAAVAEADRLDHGWRQEELEAKRDVIPDAENGAEVVAQFTQLLPNRWPTPERDAIEHALKEGMPVPTDEHRLSRVFPPQQLNDALNRYLVDSLEDCEAALPVALSLVERSRGRFPSARNTSYLSTRSTTYDIRSMSRYLQYYALLQIQEQNPAEAVTACRAMFNVARSIGDEPSLFSVLIRISCRARTKNTIERLLAQGEINNDDLRMLQNLMEEDLTVPLFLIGTRAERAGFQVELDEMDSGSALNQFAALGQMYDDDERANRYESMRLYFPNVRLQYRAEILRFHTEFVEIAKLPVEKQTAALEGLKKRIAERASPLIRMATTALDMLAGVCQRSSASSRTMMVTLAVERFRLAHGRWPDSLSDLCPKYLWEVPLDPFDGHPLRYRVREDGVVIYSVGVDQTDDGGNLPRGSANSIAPGMDLGFQLWNVDKRRQPPEVPAAELP